jgi:murein L,D-transpeptidase YafK
MPGRPDFKLGERGFGTLPRTDTVFLGSCRSAWRWIIHGTACLLLLWPLSPLAVPTPKIDRILVLKRKHELRLLSGSKLVKSYPMSLGRGGLKRKQRQGDRRTPEGLYRIDWRNPESRFHLALHISYPQEADRERARKLGVDPGGDIEIHGLGHALKPSRARHRFGDWTDGCIAVTDPEIEEIWRLVPDGTPVEIRP